MIETCKRPLTLRKAGGKLLSCLVCGVLSVLLAGSAAWARPTTPGQAKPAA